MLTKIDSMNVANVEQLSQALKLVVTTKRIVRATKATKLQHLAVSETVT
jgi:hypothetical protein